MVMVPSVHINGTSKDELLRQLGGARDAVRYAMERLREATPNARDYYVQERGAFSNAMLDHLARMEKLASVFDELGEIIEAVS